jgi:hypothetical protein
VVGVNGSLSTSDHLLLGLSCIALLILSATVSGASTIILVFAFPSTCIQSLTLLFASSASILSTSSQSHVVSSGLPLAQSGNDSIGLFLSGLIPICSVSIVGSTISSCMGLDAVILDFPLY